MSRYLNQFIVYDRGTPDLDVSMSTAREPLKHERYPPRKVVQWSTLQADYWVGYWVKRGCSEMSDQALKELVTRGYTARR